MRFIPKGTGEAKINMFNDKIIDTEAPLLGINHLRMEQFIREQIVSYLKNKDSWGEITPKTILHILGHKGCGSKTAAIKYCTLNDINLIIVSGEEELKYEEVVVAAFEEAKKLDHCVLYFDSCERMLLRNSKYASCWNAFKTQYQNLSFRDKPIWIMTRASIDINWIADDYHNSLMLRGEVALFDIPVTDMDKFFLICLKKYTNMLYPYIHPIEKQPEWNALKSNLPLIFERATYGEVDEFVHRILRDFRSTHTHLSITPAFIMNYVNGVPEREITRSDGTPRQVKTIASLKNFEIAEDLFCWYNNRMMTVREKYFDVDKTPASLSLPLPSISNGELSTFKKQPTLSLPRLAFAPKEKREYHPPPPSPTYNPTSPSSSNSNHKTKRKKGTGGISLLLDV